MKDSRNFTLIESIDVLHEGDLGVVCRKWSELLSPRRFGFSVGLSGPLGAGKTTFVRSLIKELRGNPEEVSSPSYVLEHIYRVPEGEVHHWDLYRLQNAPEEIFEESPESTLTLIEWPERGGEKLYRTLDCLLEIHVLESAAREFRLWKTRV